MHRVVQAVPQAWQGCWPGSAHPPADQQARLHFEKACPARFCATHLPTHFPPRASSIPNPTRLPSPPRASSIPNPTRLLADARLPRNRTSTMGLRTSPPTRTADAPRLYRPSSRGPAGVPAAWPSLAAPPSPAPAPAWPSAAAPPSPAPAPSSPSPAAGLPSCSSRSSSSGPWKAGSNMLCACLPCKGGGGCRGYFLLAQGLQAHSLARLWQSTPNSTL